MSDAGADSGWRSRAARIASHRGVAPAFAILVTTLCVRGVFTLSEIFCFRDLSVYFWPHHRWLRRTLLSGQSPLWDPNPGGGYATMGDPALHLAFLPTLPLRFLPEIPGFNLSVALPFPIAAAGVYLFARRHASPWAAAIAAAAYAASGPILSTGSCNNLAWCAAIIPFVFWTIDGIAAQPTARRFGLLAGLFAVELFAGEPVTLAGTGVLATAYAFIAAPGDGATLRARARVAAATVGAGLSGVLLAAVQALPLLDAMRRSIRGSGLLADTWSLHPMRLAESVLPFVYGNYLGLQDAYSPWLFALNSRREPYLPSLYVGAIALMLAGAGLCAARQRVWAIFNGAAIAGTLVCAFGSATPVYPALQAAVPLLANFRYPTKYAVLAMLPLAALVAAGWDGATAAAGRLGRARLGAAAAAAAAVVGVAALAGLAATGSGTLQSVAGLGSAAAGLPEDWLLGSVLGAVAGFGGTVVAGAALFAFGGDGAPRAALVRAAVAVVFAVDLVAANGGLNPTVDASLFDAPEWAAATRAHPDERVHVAQSFVTIAGRETADGPPAPAFPAGVPPAIFLTVWNTALCQYPSAWDVRQALSPELTGLRPREYLTLLEDFSRSDRSVQYRYLRFAATRYALASKPPPAPSREVLPLPQLAPMALYELDGAGGRCRILTGASVEPDTDRAVAGLFDPLVAPESRLLVSAETAPAGATGEASETSASIVSETTTSVTLAASVAGSDAYVVLLDSYDPGWTATVDGQPAEVVRAWGVYRAVRLAPGRHTVAMTYVSRPFRAGLAVTALTALVLGVLVLRRPRAAEPGSA